MNIFILDDMYDIRKSVLTRGMSDEEKESLNVALNYEEAVKLLKLRANDVYMLDHDLGDIGAEEKDGRDIAQFIVENNIGENAIFIVHSSNEPASGEMVNILKQNGNRTVVYAPVDRMRRELLPWINYRQLISELKTQRNN